MSDNILDIVNLQKLGELLQQARKQQGFTQADAAAIIDVSRTTMTAIEKGQRQIKSSELIKLAEAYSRDVSDFVRGRPVVQPFAPQFRSTLSQTAEDEAKIATTINQLEELCTNYYELENILEQPMVRNYPPVYKYGRMRTNQAAEGLAIAERNRLGLGDGPIASLRNILEQGVGLRIFYLEFDAYKYSAFYFFEPTLGGCIALNIAHNHGRIRWSLAHEYAHFLAHRTTPDISFEHQYQRKPEGERFADSFAEFFLMPSSSLNTRFNVLYQAKGRITPADLIRLAHEYGVSVEAMTRRLENMNLLPTGIWEALKKRQFKVEETQKQLALEFEPKEKLPNGYVSLVMEAYYQGKLTIGEVAYFLQVDLLEARERTSESTWAENINDDVMEFV